MLEMPQYINPVSLIAGGCPQFLDYEAPEASLEKIRYGFAEVVENDGGKTRKRLRAFRKNEDGEYADEMNPRLLAEDFDYDISASKAIQPWLDNWLPVPFLRAREQNWPDSDECRFEYGPSNWARARLSKSAQNPGFLRLVLVFDMQVESKQDKVYAALTTNDVEAQAYFRLAWRYRDNSWFLDLSWVEEWLRGVWDAWVRKNRVRLDEDRQFEHLASYLTWLEVIRAVSNQCEVYVVRPEGQCVDVDLVLDIGNSRSTGILIETQAQSVTSLNNSYLLQLRDMDEPDKIYVEPFETRVEFSETKFGNDALSTRSGRKTPAFAWASPVRIGPEAARLATLSRCEKGSTGMSSPKRYLWDEHDWQRTWRFNTKSENSPYVTRGPLAQQINSSGTPLCCMDDKLFTKNRLLKKQERESAFESLFTRSSLMMFLLVEIIQQALLTVNSPGQRLRRELPARPRRLRQIIFTVPAGMPIAEQRIYRRWGLWATRVLWEALGWETYYIGNRRPSKSQLVDYRVSPLVRCDWDEATCTELVYIYNEIVHKFQGDARLFCDLAGRPREFDDHVSPSVRVAAIDIGGGTTDLSITTFELASELSSTPRLAAHPNFHDGFNIAGDDILRAVVAEHVLAAIGDALSKAGVTDARSALTLLFGRAAMDSSVSFLNQRIQFVRQIAAPVGLCLLALYEKTDLASGSGRINFRIGDCFSPAIAEETGKNSKKKAAEKDAGATELPCPLFPLPSQAALDYLADFVKDRTGAGDFNALDIPISMDPRAIDETVRGSLKDALANLCEVVNMYDCDALLLTGRPSCWPGVVNIVASFLPVPPSRIFPMNSYPIGAWYPFSNGMGKMTDPKTTVVVGAILCALAEGQMEGFSFDPRNLRALSTARYIGEMELTGQIRNNKIWFNVDPGAETVEPETRQVEFNGPISVGFRQLDAERWTTTRFYLMDYSGSQRGGAANLNLPLKVDLKFEIREEADDSERDEGEFTIERIKDANGQDMDAGILEMRLQTLPREDGFWLDTGVIYEN